MCTLGPKQCEFICKLYFAGKCAPSGYFSQMSKWALYLTRVLRRLFDLNQVFPPPSSTTTWTYRVRRYGGKLDLTQKQKQIVFVSNERWVTPQREKFCSHWRRIFPVKFQKFRGIVAVDFVRPFYFPWSAFKTRLPRSNFLLLFFENSATSIRVWQATLSPNNDWDLGLEMGIFFQFWEAGKKSQFSN